MEGDRDVGVGGDSLDLARGAVDARRDVGGHNRRAAAVHGLDRLLCRRAGRAVEAGPEDRVDDAARALERGGCLSRLDLAAGLRQPCVVLGRVVRELIRRPEEKRLDLEAGLGQEPCGDKPVAAVVALAADDPDRPRLGHVTHRLGERRARGLHQLKRRNAALIDRLGVGGTHALGVVKRIQPVGKAHRPQRRGDRPSAWCQAPCLAPGVLAGAWAGDDDRRGQVARVRERDVQVHPALVGGPLGRAREAKRRSRVIAALDLDLVQAQAAEAERLQRRLLGGEARGEVPGGMRRAFAASSSRSVKIRSASAGRRSSARSIRSISIRSMPAPAVTRPA